MKEIVTIKAIINARRKARQILCTYPMKQITLLFITKTLKTILNIFPIFTSICCCFLLPLTTAIIINCLFVFCYLLLLVAFFILRLGNLDFLSVFVSWFRQLHGCLSTNTKHHRLHTIHYMKMHPLLFEHFNDIELFLRNFTPSSGVVVIGALNKDATGRIHREKMAWKNRTMVNSGKVYQLMLLPLL